MNKKDKVLLKLLTNKYTEDMLISLKKPKRFKELSGACKGEKMRTQRLRELEKFNLIKVKPERIGGRSVSIYEISETGKKALKLAEEVAMLEEK